MAFSSRLSLLPPWPFLWMLKVSVCLFGIHSCSLSPGVPTPCSFCMHPWTLLDILGYIPVHTGPHPSFHICTCLGVCTRVDWVLRKQASLLSPSRSSWKVPYSTDTSSAHSSVPPMWLMMITVSMAVASWGQSAFILKQ